MIRALSFDLDGTLYRVRKLRTSLRLIRLRGVLPAFLKAREAIRHEGAKATGSALLEREIELVASQLNVERAEIAPILVELSAALPDALTRGMRPYEGVRAALERAHQRGLKLAVLSDYDPERKLKNLGLDDLPFEAKIGCEKLGALKPNPESFRALADALSLSTSEVLHVGDREDLDVEGAMRAGMAAWRFAPKRPTPSQAGRTFQRWTEDLFDAIPAPSTLGPSPE